MEQTVQRLRPPISRDTRGSWSIVHTKRGPIALKMEANIHKKVKFSKMFGRIVLEKNLLLRDLSEKYKGLLPYDRDTYLSFVEI